MSSTDPRRRGTNHGVRHRAAIVANVAGFRDAAVAAGWEPARLEQVATDMWRRLPDDERAELTAIGEAAGIAPGAHLAYSLTGHVVAPEECTVVAAVGSAAATGLTVLVKNSDKIGADSLTGQGYHRYKEINVVTDTTTEDGVRLVGVVAAGTTSLKMGANDAGVAVASNIARTTELRMRDRSLDDLRALDRGRILHRALHFRSAWDAAVWVMKAITETPMATPGNVHLVAPDRMFVVEGSYDRLALETARDRVVVRANAFVLLDELNDPQDDSSPARRRRALELLTQKTGSITAADLRDLSADHHDGPGMRSICRHSEDHRDETTLASMVVDFGTPPGSAGSVGIALGKPCWVWQTDGAVLEIALGSIQPVPAAFTDGSAWVAAYREDPAST